MNRKNEKEVERRNQEADEAWKEYQGTGQSVSHETMMEWFDTWGTDWKVNGLKHDKRL